MCAFAACCRALWYGVLNNNGVMMKVRIALMALVLMMVGCATTTTAPVPALLLADEQAMLSQPVSEQVTNQALSGIYSAIHVRGQGALAASSYTTASDSTTIVSTLVLDDDQREAIGEAQGEALLQSRFASNEAESDLLLYTLISWLPVDGDQALLEVVVALADGRQVRAAAGQPQQQALAAATRWYAVTRKAVSRSEMEADGQPDSELLLPLIIELSVKAISLLPK